MAKKDKVSLLRSEQFETVDDALTSAMLRLDASNERIVELLSSEQPGQRDLAGMAFETPEPADTPRLKPGAAARSAAQGETADA